MIEFVGAEPIIVREGEVDGIHAVELFPVQLVRQPRFPERRDTEGVLQC